MWTYPDLMSPVFLYVSVEEENKWQEIDKITMTEKYKAEWEKYVYQIWIYGWL